jgi:hypothetical protein
VAAFAVTETGATTAEAALTANGTLAVESPPIADGGLLRTVLVGVL